MTNNTLNKILLINLSTKSNKLITISDNILNEYIGGRGLGVKLFTSFLSTAAEPYEANNPVVITTGPLTGTSIPGSNKYSLITRSPLTKAICISSGEGFFGVELKHIGLIGLIIIGKASNLSYLLINNQGNAVLKDATLLKGRDNFTSWEILKKWEGDIHALTIGNAGENKVSFASLVYDGEINFTEGGMGAVLGSKLLKAIVIQKGYKGYNDIPIANPLELTKIVESAKNKIKISPVTYSVLSKFNTISFINILNQLGLLSTKNFTQPNTEEIYSLYAEKLYQKNKIRKEICANNYCIVGCGLNKNIQNYKPFQYSPDLKSIWALGINCGIFDIEYITKAYINCTKHGLSPLSTGSVIACAMELINQKIINIADLKFNPTDLIHLIDKIALKESIGKHLSMGAKKFAEANDAPDIAMHVKGMDIPIIDPRGAVGQALGFATANEGASYDTGFMIGMEAFAIPKKIDRFLYNGKADLLVIKQNQNIIEDSLGLCKLTGLAYNNNIEYYAAFLTAVIGKTFNADKLNKSAQKIFDLERIFNLSVGFSSKDDTLPKRFCKEPLNKGLSANKIVNLNKLLENYYYVRKWDSNGCPTLTEEEEKKIYF